MPRKLPLLKPTDSNPWAFAPPALAAMILLLLCGRAHALLPPQEAQKLYDRVKPSLVGVQYTYKSELGRREFVGAGIIVSGEGLVITSIGLVPEQIPDEQMTEFKIIVPGDAENEIDADFQGRDERSSIAFIKTHDPQKWTPLKFQEEPVKIGDTVISVGLLPKSAGYTAYLTQAPVSALLRGPVPQVLVGAQGLCVLGSPVFNEAGLAIGMVNHQADQSVLLNDAGNPLATVISPPRVFVPARDFLQSLADPPTPQSPLKLPWMGVAQLTGLKKAVADYENLKGQAAVQVGDVIPGLAADKAGLKAGNVIVKMDGQPLERGDEPDEAAAILMRKIHRLKVGAKVTFSVLDQRDKPLRDVTVMLAERPKPPNEAARFYAEDLGFTAREVVFEDTYERKLPADSPGVVVALVKPSSSAQTAGLHYGDLVTRLNQTAITDLKQFKQQYEEFRKASPREGVVLEVMRGVNTQVIRIEPPQ
jgi:serine protease Do